MFYMARATGTTDSVDYDIFADLKSASQFDGVDNSVHPFVVISLRIETNAETGISINGDNEIPLQIVRISGEDVFYGMNISLQDKMRMKKIEIADTGITWSAVYQYL